ncbi:MAG: hypothetical protein ACAI43_09815 [Phycisphaerae bacterium]|nr:hypothetical protein [Tepidisphaeraceae bacterium]
MSDKPAIACPHCGKSYAVTPEYLAQYGGQDTACAKCGNLVRLPRSLDELMPSADPSPATEVATPVAAVPAHREPDGIWRDGKHVVVMRGHNTPNRCLECGRDLDTRMRSKTLMWLPDKRGGLTGLMIKSAVAPSVLVKYNFCPEHRRRMSFEKPARVLLIAGGAVMVMAFVLAVLNYSRTANVVVAAGGISVALGFVLSLIPGRLRIDLFDQGCAWVFGFSAAYRKRLPDLRQAHAENVDRTADELDAISG